MIDWLKKRLSPIKDRTPRWVQLAEAIQEYWGELFDPELKKAKNLRSIYTADKDGALRILRELGWYYEVDLDQDNRPLAVAHRKVELLLKDTEIPLLSTIRRACPGIEIEWKPLYARMGKKYGTEFLIDFEVDPAWITNVIPSLDGSWQLSSIAPSPLKEGVFLTSRAVLSANMASLEDPTWIEKVRHRAHQVRPLHIVFDGFHFYAFIEVFMPISVHPEVHLTKEMLVRFPWCGSALDGTWQLGFDGHLFRLDGKRLDGKWKVGAGTPAMPYASLIACRVTGKVGIGKECIIPQRRISLRVGERFLRLDGDWQLGMNPMLILFASDMRKDMSVQMVPEISLGISDNMIISYPVTPAFLTSQVRLMRHAGALRSRVDGTWGVGEAPRSLKINGSWKVQRSGILVDTEVFLKKATAMGFFRKLKADKLNGSWGIGGGGGIGVQEETACTKQIGIDGEFLSDFLAHSRKAVALTYPVNPERLGSLVRLKPWKRLDGRWGVGSVAGNAPKVGNGWKLGSGYGVRAETEAAGNISTACGMYVRLGKAHYRVGHAWFRRLNGTWAIGAFAQLDGTWRLNGTVQLRAPHIGPHYRRVNGSWELGVTRRLDRGWKVGETGADVEVSIRKAA